MGCSARGTCGCRCKKNGEYRVVPVADNEEAEDEEEGVVEAAVTTSTPSAKPWTDNVMEKKMELS